MFWLILILLVLLFLLISVIINVMNKDTRATEEALQSLFLKKNQVNTNILYEYEDVFHEIKVKYIFDAVQKKIFISNTSPTFISIPFSEIIGCEVLLDDYVVGGIGKTRVGELDWESGITASATKNKFKLYQIVICRENCQTPHTILTLINNSIFIKHNVDYSKAVEFAKQITANIKLII